MLRKRVAVLVAAAVMMLSMLVASAPAFAQGGHTSCKAFGQETAGLTEVLHPFGQVVSGLAPASGTIHGEQATLCEPKS